MLRPSDYGLRAGAVFGVLTGLISAVEVASGQTLPMRLLYFLGGAVGGLLFGFEAGAVREDESRRTERLIDGGLVVLALALIVFLVIVAAT
jgi:hypothetical protein